jgi:hypothetical protein
MKESAAKTDFGTISNCFSKTKNTWLTFSLCTELWEFRRFTLISGSEKKSEFISAQKFEIQILSYSESLVSSNLSKSLK